MIAAASAPKWTTSRLILAIVLLSSFTSSRVGGQQHAWNLDYLAQWIQAHRHQAPAAVESELLLWPQWPGGCYDLTAYFANLGSEFTRRCGPVVEKALTDTAASCLGDASSPADVVRRLSQCSAQALTVPFWVGKLGQCTVTSYVTAAEMSEQDRADWATFIEGLTDVQALLGLANLFEAGKLATASDLRPPRSLEDAAKLTDQLRSIAAAEKARYGRVAKIPARLASLRDAALTVPSLRRADIESLADAAVEELGRCNPEGAEELWSMAKLEMVRHVGHLRSNVAVAENAYHCAARKQGFDRWSLWQQQQFLGQRDGGNPGDAILGREWQHANAEQQRAVTAYERLRDDPRLSLERLAAARRRREDKSRQLDQLVAAVDACLGTCGERRDGCALPLATLAEAVRNERRLACVQGGLADEHQLDRRLVELDRLELVGNNLASLTRSAATALGAPLRRCDLPAARAELGELGQKMRQVAGEGSGESCFQKPLAALEGAVDECESICQSEEVTGCGRVGATVRRVERGVGR